MNKKEEKLISITKQVLIDVDRTDYFPDSFIIRSPEDEQKFNQTEILSNIWRVFVRCYQERFGGNDGAILIKFEEVDENFIPIEYDDLAT